MIRHQDWHERLKDYFDSVADRPFHWGEHDCALFVCGAIDAMTGQDLAADLRGVYSSAFGATRLVRRKFNARSLDDVATAVLGSSRHISRAKRGDVVAYEGALGICCGSQSRFIGTLDDFGAPLIADGREPICGLIGIPTSRCSSVWSVPFHG